jgi:hypothetical protein
MGITQHAQGASLMFGVSPECAPTARNVSSICPGDHTTPGGPWLRNLSTLKILVKKTLSSPSEPGPTYGWAGVRRVILRRPTGGWPQLRPAGDTTAEITTDTGLRHHSAHFHPVYQRRSPSCTERRQQRRFEHAAPGESGSTRRGEQQIKKKSSPRAQNRSRHRSGDASQRGGIPWGKTTRVDLQKA